MEQKIRDIIFQIIKNNITVVHSFDFVVEHPADLKMGDYSTNVAMVYFGAISKAQNQIYSDEIKEGKLNISHVGNFSVNNFNSPRALAEAIVQEINKSLIPEISKVEVAGVGFINFYLTKDFFTESVKEILRNEDFGKNNVLEGKKVLVEYTDPNPFKPFHIGHLMSNSIGESISRLVEFSGAKTIRANYQGDVGLHVAKALYGLLEKGKPEEFLSVEEKAEYIGSCYSYASNLYEEDEKVKVEIDKINKKVYEKSDEELNSLYKWGREITLEAFETIYKKLGTKFEYYFFESIMAPIGMKIIQENTPDVFEESDGAIVFHADNHDPKLHTRVFVTSGGLPTYEAKEVGLTVTKFEKVNPDISIVITAIEQGDYMRVVQKAISLIYPEYESRMKHITHGMLRFATGKMSSRKGNVITGESLLKEVESSILEKIKDRDLEESEKKKIAQKVGVSALKYSILKQSSGSDVIYDFEKSISFEGDSGPYLQYSYARANSIVNKAKEVDVQNLVCTDKSALEIEKFLYRFPEVVYRASTEFASHYVANYLIELARAYNTFYGSTQIINENDENSSYNVALCKAFAKVMKDGLWLIGIESPEKM
jgi:arginyl-tRNA synthetase